MKKEKEIYLYIRISFFLLQSGVDVHISIDKLIHILFVFI